MEGVLTLQIHVQPGAASTAWAGWYGTQALKLKLSAPAVEGKANKACVRFMAGLAGVPQRSVTIVRGVNSRDKLIRIESVSEARYRAIIKSAMMK